MENIYLVMIIALALLAIADLVVGVSNDAVNFLNSAIGSKAVSFKTIMIVASLGVALGAIFSSGLMEVARKGIFNPNEFMFDEIMIIFMAVMITDILLLDFFNTIGMPTSTTVSIVFELLGAAVAMAMIKIFNESGSYSEIVNYINTSSAIRIIQGILLSVVFAFSIGALVQWITRLLLSYDFNTKAKWVGALFGGVALTAITYFIFIKGVKGTPYANETFNFTNGLTIKKYLEAYVVPIVAISLVIWTALAFLFMYLINIYKLIILVGTFALALAFAGNDLVNFIGVPITALESYKQWQASGLEAHAFSMSILSGKVETPAFLLFIAGMIMVITLWFSSKAKDVVKTSLDLSSQSDTKERFQPNFLSRGFVRIAIVTSRNVSAILPEAIHKKIDKQFKLPEFNEKDPAFDLVRAAVNLMVAAVLISIATSMKLPLSTTYVTFMVAMGTSLADRAWGVESAVYRVAGVINVIGGWFFTAIIAFLASGVIAFLLHLNLQIMMPVLLLAAFVLLIRNYYSYDKKVKAKNEDDSLTRAESRSVQGVIYESADNISSVVVRGRKIFSNAIVGLARQDLSSLKLNKKLVSKLVIEIDDLRDNIFYFIKNLDESSIDASDFYIHILGYLQDMAQALEEISKASYKHVNNNHNKLKFNQIKELKELEDVLDLLFYETERVFDTQTFENINAILNKKKEIFDSVTQKISKQVSRTRTEESSPKNTTLYFTVLLETKDLIVAVMQLLERYNDSYDSSIASVEIQENEE